MNILAILSLFIISLSGMWIAVSAQELPGIVRVIIGVLAWCIFISLFGTFNSGKESPDGD